MKYDVITVLCQLGIYLYFIMVTLNVRIATVKGDFKRDHLTT